MVVVLEHGHDFLLRTRLPVPHPCRRKAVRRWEQVLYWLWIWETAISWQQHHPYVGRLWFQHWWLFTGEIIPLQFLSQSIKASLASMYVLFFTQYNECCYFIAEHINNNTLLWLKPWHLVHWNYWASIVQVQLLWLLRGFLWILLLHILRTVLHIISWWGNGNLSVSSILWAPVHHDGGGVPYSMISFYDFSSCVPLSHHPLHSTLHIRRIINATTIT